MPTFRQSALLRKEEAVSKGEIEKCARAVHLSLSFISEARNYYRKRRESCQEVLTLGYLLTFRESASLWRPVAAFAGRDLTPFAN